MTKRQRSVKSRSTAGIVLVATIAIVAAGCSKSSSGTTTTTTTTTSTTAPSTTSTTAASTTSTTAASTTTSTAPGGKSGSALLDLFKSGQHVTFAATYKVSGASGSLSSLTLAQQSPNLLFKGSTSSGTFELITTGAKSYICSQTAGAWTCFSSGTATANPEAELFALYEPKTYLPEFQAAANAAGGHATFSSKTVNGFSLSCLSVSGVPGENGSGTFCMTSQGVLGYVSWTGAKASESGSFEITSYSATVPASDFTLPATPTKIP
jgi:hypothetical protein